MCYNSNQKVKQASGRMGRNFQGKLWKAMNNVFFFSICKEVTRIQEEVTSWRMTSSPLKSMAWQGLEETSNGFCQTLDMLIGDENQKQKQTNKRSHEQRKNQQENNNNIVVFLINYFCMLLYIVNQRVSNSFICHERVNHSQLRLFSITLIARRVNRFFVYNPNSPT